VRWRGTRGDDAPTRHGTTSALKKKSRDVQQDLDDDRLWKKSITHMTTRAATNSGLGDQREGGAGHGPAPGGKKRFTKVSR
jgi:hypothetical protein